MSWGDFKRFANTPRGRQQLFDVEGNVRFSVKGRGDGKLKMRNKNFRFEAKHDVKDAKQMKEKIKKKVISISFPTGILLLSYSNPTSASASVAPRTTLFVSFERRKRP